MIFMGYVGNRCSGAYFISECYVKLLANASAMLYYTLSYQRFSPLADSPHLIVAPLWPSMQRCLAMFGCLHKKYIEREKLQSRLCEEHCQTNCIHRCMCVCICKCMCECVYVYAVFTSCMARFYDFINQNEKNMHPIDLRDAITFPVAFQWTALKNLLNQFGQ